MKTRNLAKKTISFGIVMLLLAMTAVSAFAAPSGESNRTVRVGFFAYPGYHEINDGVRSGYGYDFLMLLQRYTNLNYEFVGYDKSWEEMQQMLLDGEIDMVTSARKTIEREQIFDFSEPIGTNSAQINVRADDERFIPGDYSALDGITIGELSGNSRNSDVADFAAEKGFSFRVNEYETAEELDNALKNNAVDAVASSSLRKTSGEMTVAEFAPQDFFVIVGKGNTGLLNEINYGIAQMDMNEGNWRDNLLYKNYHSEYETVLSFTQREKEYIKQVNRGMKTITVTAQPDRDPYSFVEDGKLTGIIPDYFDHLMQMAGLPYTIMVAADRDEFQTWTMTNHTDIVMDCCYAYSPSTDLDFGLVTDPYMQLTTSRVIRKGFSGPIESIATVDSQGTDYIEEDIAGDAQYIIVATVEEAMRSVSEGRADACYVYTYMADKFINSDVDSNLQSTILEKPVYNEYVYVSPDADHELCSILNKCIKADAAGVLDEYVKQYTNITLEQLSLKQYLKIHPEILYIASALLVVLILLTSVAVVRSRTAKIRSNQLERELEQQRELDESLTFTNFFLDAFISAYYVDLETLEYKVYKRTEELNRDYPILDNYFESISDYINRGVHPDDRDELMYAARPDVMRKMLEEIPEYTHSFRDISGEKERIYKMQVIRGADEDHAAFGFVDITDELLEQQMRLLGAVPLSPDILVKANIGLWAFELDYDKAPRMYVDDTMLGLIGLKHQVSPEETYHAWYDHIDEASYGTVTNAVEKMSAGEHAEVQYPWHHPDGHTMIVRCGGVRNPEYKSGIRIEGTHQDVTETLHFQSEGAKRDRDIIEILASEYTSVYYIDLITENLTPYSMNESTESAFGKIFRSDISFGEAYQMYVDELVSPEDREMMLNAGSVGNIKKELRNKKAFITTYSDAQGRYSEMKFVKVGDEDDKPVAVALGFADKDEEIRAELQRETIAARDAAVIAGLSDDFGCVVYVNTDTLHEVHYRFDPLLDASIPGWEEITDYEVRMRTLGRTVAHPDDRDFFLSPQDSKQKILGTVKKDGVYYHNFRIIIDGEIKYYQLKIVRDENSDNHIIVGIRNVDETVKREMEYQEKLEMANKSKTDFLFNMSHDIRTPMNAIIGFTQLAKKHIDDKERTVDSLNKIESSGNHLLELINEVLDMSRVEAGKLHSEMKTVNILEEAMRLVTICQESASERNISLEFHNGNISHPVVVADELHINQIVMNVLGNAIKYTLPGGRIDYSIEETVSDIRGYGKYIFTIEDTGIGMSEKYLEHIYESFSREDNASTSEIQGTGLGMTIVKRLVDYMDGNIDIKSRQGEGTKVTITLYLKICDEKEEKSQTAEHLTVNLDGKRVLLVEDNELNREIAIEILHDQGLSVDEAVNGYDAVEKVKQRGTYYYDFILMDIQMPLMDGFEATSQIRKLPGADKLPIIALSANAFEEDKIKSIEAGMNDHVAKPIVISELLAAIEKYVK